MKTTEESYDVRWRNGLFWRRTGDVACPRFAGFGYSGVGEIPEELIHPATRRVDPFDFG